MNYKRNSKGRKIQDFFFDTISLEYYLQFNRNLHAFVKAIQKITKLLMVFFDPFFEIELQQLTSLGFHKIIFELFSKFYGFAKDVN